MTIDVKKTAKEAVKAVNVATVVIGALQTAGLLAALSPTANGLITGLVAALNQLVHAIPATLLTDDSTQVK